MFYSPIQVVQGEDVHFEPIVQLEEVEVRTGEEDEEVVYSQRAKLYRFTDGQWKERGVGDMKILKHKQTGILLYRNSYLRNAFLSVMNSNISLEEMKDIGP